MKSAKIDDDLNIVTTYDKIKGARLWVNQSCYRGDELLVTAFSEAACISPEGKPKRAPSWMINQLSQYLLSD
jgi:acyl-CoA thioester hydrolase